MLFTHYRPLVIQVNALLERGEASKRTLVRANMRLVFHIARYYKFRGVAYPDLVQEGTFGLIKVTTIHKPHTYPTRTY
jgi:DNA-directed RNA polymerase sigma subunit (sigma70/sigma32)